MAKKRKLSSVSGDKEEKAVDRISMLPDELIHYIMSFIDTKYAVQASVLSKRWIHIWKSLPFLNFDVDDYAHSQSDKFNDFVDKVFRLRDDYNIQCFKLRWNYFHRYIGAKTSVARWIDASVERGVQEVTIQLLRNYDFWYQIPPSLLNSKSLKKLTLRTNLVHGILPKSMNLPQLKFMYLEGISASDIDFSRRLFSSCPVLETLNMLDCNIPMVESPSLKQFAYTNNNYTSSVFKLSAPDLQIFTCESYATQKFNLQNCSDKLSYVRFNILYDSGYKRKVWAKNTLKLLIVVHKVKQLELSPGFLEVLSDAIDLVNYQLPCLNDLQTLRLKMWLTRGSLRSMAYLLTISPNIKKLFLKPQKLELRDFGDDWEEGFSLPGMLSHLNIVRIENVEGCHSEFKVLGFLMKNAKGLEEVALYPYSNVDCSRKLKKQFKKKLRTLPRASPHINMRWGASKSTLRI